MSNNGQIADLTQRKNTSRAYLRSLSPDAKIAQLVNLQERYYEVLSIRETNGGKPIPVKWKKWHVARHEREHSWRPLLFQFVLCWIERGNADVYWEFWEIEKLSYRATLDSINYGRIVQNRRGLQAPFCGFFSQQTQAVKDKIYWTINLIEKIPPSLRHLP